ncbi:MAG: hypothetical protein ABIJ08_03560, partial [Nanoarchaeota archaeon]
MKKVQDATYYGESDAPEMEDYANVMDLIGRIVNYAQMVVMKYKINASKKAQFFSLIYVSTLIGMLIFAYIAFNSKQNSFKTELGERQFELLSKYHASESSLFCADAATKYSIYQSIYDIGKKGGFASSSDCGSYGDFELWNAQGRECYPAARKNLGNLLRDYLGDYTGSNGITYPWSSFPLKDYLEIDNGQISYKRGVSYNERPMSWVKLQGQDYFTVKDVGSDKAYKVYADKNEWASVSVCFPPNLDANKVDNYDFVFNEVVDVYEYDNGKWVRVDNTEFARTLSSEISNFDPNQASDFKFYDKNFRVMKEEYIGGERAWRLNQNIISDHCDDNIACTADVFDDISLSCKHLTKGCSCTTNSECDDNNDCTVNICSDMGNCESNVRGLTKCQEEDKRIFDKIMQSLSGPVERVFRLRKLNKTEVWGIAAAPIVHTAYFYGEDKADYIVKPNTYNEINYTVSVYDEIVSEVKRLKEECLKKEQSGIVLSDCIKEEIKNINDARNDEWALGSCYEFSDEEEKCLNQGKVPMFSGGVYDRCDVCPAGASCSDYINQKYCETDPCNLGCSWAISSCVEELTQDEQTCLAKNNIQEEKVVPDYRSGAMACTECKDIPGADCKDYNNELFCSIDPCNLGCYSELDNNMIYDQCNGCPGNAVCGDYANQEYCELDQCEMGCKWENGACRKLLQGESKANVERERTFKICITQQDKKFYVYDNGFDKRPVKIKFAISFPDMTPPPAIMSLEAYDKLVGENSAVIRWDKSTAVDISHYNVYYKEIENKVLTTDEINNLDKENIKQELKQDIISNMLNPIRVSGIDNGDWITTADFNGNTGRLLNIYMNNVQIGKDALYKYWIKINDVIENKDNKLEKNKVYYLKKVKDVKELLYVLDAQKREVDDKVAAVDDAARNAINYAELKDGKTYAFAIVPVDVNDNANLEIEKVAVASLVDDLAPDTLQIMPDGYEPNTAKFRIKWLKLDKNTDGSVFEDSERGEIRLYYGQDRFYNTQEQGVSRMASDKFTKLANEFDASGNELEVIE